jgi:hypothetical protein
MKASKSKNLLFAGLISKKGQAELALSWWKGKVNHYLFAWDVGAHCVRPSAVTRRNGLRAHAMHPYDNRTDRAGFALGLTV